VALRPVSELGLVDLTDLASPSEETTTGRRKPRAAASQAEKPRAGGKRTSKPRAGSRAQKPPAPPARPKAANGPSAPSEPRGKVGRRGRVAARVGITAVTWTVAGATGVLLGRAAIRR
jgi:hypothetical protein